MRQKLIRSLSSRIATEIDPRNPIKFLQGIDLGELLDATIPVVYLYTREKKNTKRQKHVWMAEVVTAIGHAVRQRAKLKKDSALAAKAGTFILYSFEAVGLTQVKLTKGASSHGTYVVEVLNDDAIQRLWESVPIARSEKLPSLEPYAPWTSYKHETGWTLVKTNSPSVLRALTPESHPIVFACANRAQEVGWKINRGIYTLVNWALRNKTDAFSNIWEIANEESRRSKLREAQAVASIAKRFQDTVFYHLYSFDFRGRKYPTTAYLHEQGSDLARGLLIRNDAWPIGRSGFEWLLISIASNWAGDAGRSDKLKTDKIKLRDRISWVMDNEEIILDYAENPKVNQGWMQADNPWQFLAACIELMQLRIWQVMNRELIAAGVVGEYDYESHLEAYLDGSNNGSQHLAALTRDEETAPHVNLVPLELPGDLYRFVGDGVWEELHNEVGNIPTSRYQQHGELIDKLTHLKTQINQAPMKSDLRQALIDDLKEYRQLHKDEIREAGLVFWCRITDAKHRRKVVKRNVMTIPYGGTSYGLGQQQIDDAGKHGIESLLTMEHAWGSMLGRRVFEACKARLRRPMKLLELFENAGKAAEARGEYLAWTVPITHFPVLQMYTEAAVKKTWVQYGPPAGERQSTGYYENTFQLMICYSEIPKMRMRGKQARGASPNVIHSLDAAHLALTVYRAPFAITTIHDSFGSLLGHMHMLYPLVRETFVELHEAQPLDIILAQIGVDMDKVDIGTLDVRAVLESEYCFV